MRHVTFTVDFEVPDDTPDDAIRDLAVDAWVQVEDPRDRDGNRLTFDVTSLGAVLAVTGATGTVGILDHFGAARV